MRVAGWLGIFLCASTVVAWAQVRPDSRPRIEAPAIRDCIEQESATAFEVAPDGKRAVYVRETPDATKDRMRKKVWIVDLESGVSRPLTTGPSQDVDPRWSPDGRRVAFSSARKVDVPDEKRSGRRPRRVADADEEPKEQVFVLDMTGGEAVAVTELPEGVAGFRWLDAGRLLVTGREKLAAREQRRKDDKDDSEAVEDLDEFRVAATRFFVVTLADDGPKTVRLTENLDSIETFEVSPDGKHAVALHKQTPLFEVDGRVPPKVRLWDLEAATSREIFADRKSKPLAFAWAADGSSCLAMGLRPTVDGEDMAGVNVAFLIDVATGSVRDAGLEWTRGFASLAVTASARDGFVAGLADGVRPRFGWLHASPGSAAGWRVEPFLGDGAERIREVVGRAGSDRVVYRSSTADAPSQWFSAVRSGATLAAVHRLDVCKVPFDGKRLARVEVVGFKGAGDEPVQALLYFPHEHESRAKHPLVLLTHGGPFAADYDEFSDGWSYAPNLYAARGAYVLSVNYHGSSDYGAAFGESIRHRYFELELLDLCRGIEFVAAREPVDLDRLGLCGWSNGAILSIAMLALRDEFAPGFPFTFRACVAGAGDVNWTSDYGVCEFGPAFDDYYLGGPPWSAAETYLKKSALFRAERVTTPTLVMIGARDRAVPTNQGWEWYRALQHLGKAPVRFIQFPAEKHSLTSLARRRRKLEEEMAFVDKHLFRVPDADPSFDGSRIWEAARTPARDGAAFGVRVDAAAAPGQKPVTVLIPEVVYVGGLSLGRFEVTRGQWKAFRPELDFADATANYPISGVSFEDAQAYCAWLGRVTGRRFRLPRTDELDRLADDLPDSENTLDWWAGFVASPHDLDGIRARTSEVPWEAQAPGVPPLLLPVGSRPAAAIGEPGRRQPVSDLGGNVAEWAVDDGSDLATRPTLEPKAKAWGGCAWFGTDPLAGDRTPPPVYTGFRVVEERAGR